MTSNIPTAGLVLARMGERIDARDWAGLANLLSPLLVVDHPASGRHFGRDDFVTFNRDYPGVWRFVIEDLVDAGDRAVLRARVSGAHRREGEAYHVACFASIDASGLITELVELWADETIVDPDPTPGVGGSV